MKKILLILFFLFPLYNISQEVQKVEVVKSDTQIENLNELLGQNEIKIDFLDFIIFPALTLGYEKNRNSSTAYGATMFINFDTDLGSEWNDNENYSDAKSESYTDISPGLAVGRKWINRKGFTFELMFGVGRNLLYDEDVNGMNTATIRSGVSIGKRF